MVTIVMKMSTFLSSNCLIWRNRSAKVSDIIFGLHHTVTSNHPHVTREKETKRVVMKMQYHVYITNLSKSNAKLNKLKFLYRKCVNSVLRARETHTTTTFEKKKKWSYIRQTSITTFQISIKKVPSFFKLKKQTCIYVFAAGMTSAFFVPTKAENSQ